MTLTRRQVVPWPDAADQNRGLPIGELAERAGLTVRTLHHYDRIGLVRASERTEAGHRRYAEADVRRLYQVVALRSLGVPLAEITRALEGDGFTLREAVSAQLAAVEGELRRARRMHRRLRGILEVLERSNDPSIGELTEVMAVVTMHERYYTPDQLEAPERRQEELLERVIQLDKASGEEAVFELRSTRGA